MEKCQVYNLSISRNAFPWDPASWSWKLSAPVRLEVASCMWGDHGGKLSSAMSIAQSNFSAIHLSSRYVFGNWRIAASREFNSSQCQLFGVSWPSGGGGCGSSSRPTSSRKRHSFPSWQSSLPECTFESNGLDFLKWPGKCSGIIPCGRLLSRL